MKFQLFSRRLAPYLTAYLLLVSLGLPLHKVYCACKGESELNLLASSHECGHEAVALDKATHQYEAAKSCCSSLSNDCEIAENEQHDCGSNETVIAKFNGDYLLGQENKALFTSIGFKPKAATILANEVAMVIIAKVIPIRGPTPPTPPYGRALLLRHQLFLC